MNQSTTTGWRITSIEQSNSFGND